MPEEVSNVRASVPEVIEAEVMQRISRLGGVITSIESEPNSRTSIGATLPRMHIPDFKSWLNGYSDGRGLVSED